MTAPVLVGHRGIGLPWTGVLRIPEESIPAIEWAASHHADIVEGDVQRSSDGVMFMMHDATLDRTTNGHGSTTGRPWSYISERWLEIPVDLDGNGDDDNTRHHPPSFRKWLAAAKATGKRAFIELKNGPEWSAGEVREFVAEVKRQDMAGRAVVAGSINDLAVVKAADPTIRRSVNVSGLPPAAAVARVVGDHGYATMRLTEAEAQPGYPKTLAAAGIHLFLWTLTRPEHYARALPLGAYGWMCNNTDDAWNWLQTQTPAQLPID